MPALGVGLIFLGYTAALYGYCLFRGYDVTVKQLMSKDWPPANPAKQAGKAAGDALSQLGNAVQNSGTNTKTT